MSINYIIGILILSYGELRNVMDWQTIRHRLYLYVIKRVDNTEIAEDIVQDILLKTINQLEHLQDEEKFLPWLYTIGRNTIIDHYRQKHPEQDFPDIMLVEEEDKEEVLDELGQCIYPMLEKLPDMYREALIQSHFRNKKLQEIADEKGISLVAVKSRVQRGRQQLKAYLLACCAIENDHLGNISDITYPAGCDSCGTAML